MTERLQELKALAASAALAEEVLHAALKAARPGPGSSVNASLLAKADQLVVSIGMPGRGVELGESQALALRDWLCFLFGVPVGVVDFRDPPRESLDP